MSEERSPVEIAAEPVTITFQQRHIVARAVLDSELDELVNRSPAVALTLFGVFAGAAISIGLTVASQHLPNRSLAVFVGALIASGALAVFFGIQAWRATRESNAVIERIRNRPPVTD